MNWIQANYVILDFLIIDWNEVHKKIIRSLSKILCNLMTSKRHEPLSFHLHSFQLNQLYNIYIYGTENFFRTRIENQRYWEAILEKLDESKWDGEDENEKAFSWVKVSS